MGYKDSDRTRGNPVVNVACPLCGWYRQLEGYRTPKMLERKELRFDRVDVENAPLLRVLIFSGAGRASKNAHIETVETKTLRELPEELKAQIKRQATRILAVLG